MVHIICEPIERDAPFDPRAYDVLERGQRVTQIALSRRVFNAPGHQVFLGRALVGLDAYLKGFGTVLNWHRIFRDLVASIPAEAAKEERR